MHGILEKIVSSRSGSFEKQIERLPRDAPAGKHAPRITISDAIRASCVNGSPGIIAEIKRGSPSRAFETPGKPVDIHGRINAYVEAGVQAISILTEPTFFHGSFDDLCIATSTVALPVLCKDFIVLPEQLDVAAMLGASNALIIVKIPDSLKLVDHCIKLGLEPLLEVHDEQDLLEVIDLSRENKKVNLVGINNRDLNTLDVDISTSKRLIPIARKELPRNTVIVSESGIQDVFDVRNLASAGAHGFLIGTAFMNTPVAGLREAIGRIMQATKMGGT
nr:indole-3-glycerol-phosphate synthase [Candidatus Sigynarchaeota archaeon]